MNPETLGISGLLITAILAAWFVASIPNQMTNRLGKAVKRRNPYGIVPGWTFFAPTPGTSDYRLVFRDMTAAGFTDWSEVPWCHERTLLDAVWHPDRHRTKFIVDCVNAFVITVRELHRLGRLDEADAPPWIVSVPYLALLNIVNSMPPIAVGATARQFALVEQKPSDPGAQPKLIVCSPAHSLTAVDASVERRAAA